MLTDEPTGVETGVQTELLDTGELRRSIEALLFVASEALSIDRLAKLTRAPHVAVTQTLAQLADEFAGRGIVLREIAGGYRFASAPTARAVIEAYLLPPKTTLSPAAMETLAIVAYNQPATKADIEAVRGVNVDTVVATLIDRRFIVESGRREVPGRPVEFETTPEFLESFGLRSLTELPPVDLDARATELALPIETVRAESIAPGEPPSIEADPGQVQETPATESGDDTVGGPAVETGDPSLTENFDAAVERAEEREPAHAGTH